MDTVIDFILHTDQYLNLIVENYGPLIYAVIFLIIFSETGFVVTPFLPGDGLLFTVGVIAGGTSGGLNVWLAMLITMIAAFLGNTLNYHIGRYFSKTLLEGRKLKWVNPKYIEQTHDFFEKHGQKAVILSRFLPIFRTFVPFVAGLSKMTRSKFMAYTLWGGVAWVFLLTMAGYLLGNIPFIKNNISFIVLTIIVVSVLPAIFAVAKNILKSRKVKNPA